MTQEITWYKFSDRTPEREAWIYVTDYEDIHIKLTPVSYGIAIENPFKEWAYVYIPKTPMRRHNCCGDMGKCFSTNQGLRFRCSNQDDSWPISYCPFCGEKG